MFHRILFTFLASLPIAQAFEGKVLLKSVYENKVIDRAALIAPKFILTRWHTETEKCQTHQGACTFQGIPITHLEVFNDYAVMELEHEYENYLTPVDELFDLTLPEQHTVCKILAKNNTEHVQEDACLKIRQQLQH